TEHSPPFSRQQQNSAHTVRQRSVTLHLLHATASVSPPEVPHCSSLSSRHCSPSSLTAHLSTANHSAAALSPPQASPILSPSSLPSSSSSGGQEQSNDRAKTASTRRPNTPSRPHQNQIGLAQTSHTSPASSSSPPRPAPAIALPGIGETMAAKRRQTVAFDLLDEMRQPASSPISSPSCTCPRSPPLFSA
ncbi:unnamed protein product, partial [Urochloa humidicola]